MKDIKITNERLEDLVEQRREKLEFKKAEFIKAIKNQERIVTQLTRISSQDILNLSNYLGNLGIAMAKVEGQIEELVNFKYM